MFVPIVPNATVINKDVVYSDVVVRLKDLAGNNLRIKSISNVGEYSLEKCLKKILESNPDVIFNTIQYSKEKKRVIFYTDKEISTKEYEQSSVTKCNSITNKIEILEEIKRVLVSEPNKDNDCVSLYEVLNLIRKQAKKYEKDKIFENDLEKKIEECYDNEASVIVYNFDYDTDELPIGFKRFLCFDSYNLIKFIKRHDDLFITESNSLYAKEMLAKCGDVISKCYDELIRCKDFKKQHVYGSASTNSNFYIDIDSSGVKIVSAKFPFYSYFELKALSDNNEYDYKCNSNKVISVLRGHEKEFFKRVFVRIDDLPEWTRPILYEIRQVELAKEEKKQKVKELVRKIFPFTKK